MKKSIAGILLALVMVLGTIGFTGCSRELFPHEIKKGDVLSFYDKDEELISSVTMDVDATLSYRLDGNSCDGKWKIEKSDGSFVSMPENMRILKVVAEDGSERLTLKINEDGSSGVTAGDPDNAPGEGSEKTAEN